MVEPGARSAGTSAPRRGRDPAQPPTLRVLGCDGSYPGPGGAGSGYLLEAAGVSLWLDAGPGTFAALQLVTDPRLVDALVLSHEHPDHWSDVDAFAVWRREVASHRRDGAPPPGVPVYAAPGVRERAYFGEDPALDWHEVEPAEHVVVRPLDGGGQTREAAIGGFLVCSFSVTDHGPPT